MRRLLLVGSVVWVVGVGIAAGGSRPKVVSIDARGFRAGGLVWLWTTHQRAPSLADLVRTYGRWSRCDLHGRDVLVAWTTGVRGVFTTLGALPHPSDTGCSAPGFVQPDTITVDMTRWRTDRGLHVGDNVARLRVLYPGAARHRTVWWLVTRRNDPLWGTYGQLTATTRAGRVLAFTLVIHAQGD